MFRDSITDQLFFPIHAEGWRFIPIFAMVTTLLFWIWSPLGWIGCLATIGCFCFFRDPEKVSPSRSDVILSPADGIVQMITEAPPPSELGMGDTPRHRISIFMRLTDIHVNRVPISGKVIDHVHSLGQFLNASLDKASVFNERMSVRLEIEDGRDIAFVQIAGLLARRIRCDLINGQMVKAGDRFGIIRFGSRVDVYLPENVVPGVAIGQTMIGGESILATLSKEVAE